MIKHLQILATLIIVLHSAGCAAPLVVAGGAAAGVAVTDRRSASTIIDDKNIQLKISKAIYDDEALKGNVHVNATSFNTVVILTGEAATAAQRQQAAEYARRAAKVSRVYNELLIAPRSTLESRGRASVLCAKLKSGLIGVKDVNPLHIKIVCEGENVYLMGLVTRQEATTATEALRRVKGVGQVLTYFEYLD